MPDFTVRADHIDVEQIMRQIRTRIRDKRGVDYTEAEIRELASVKLDRFLDPRAVRSDLLGHFKRQHQPAPLYLEREEWPALYAFDAELVYESSRGFVGRLLRTIRRVLNPVLKLFLNPGPILHVLHLQGPINQKHKELFERISQRLQTRDELDALNFEMFNNLVVESTRLGIEVKNLRMQVESLSTRLDFDERRARALEGVVQYRPGAAVAQPAPVVEDGDEEGGDPGDGRGPRRRRRRRGRRRPGSEGGPGQGESGGPEMERTAPAADEAGRELSGRTSASPDSGGHGERDAEASASRPEPPPAAAASAPPEAAAEPGSSPSEGPRHDAAEPSES